MINEVRGLVHEEITIAMKEHQMTISDSVLSVIRSTAVTPVPATPEPQVTHAHVMSLLRQGQLNAAFQQVCMNLSLKLYTVLIFYLDTL